MTPDEAAAAFTILSPDQQIRALADHAYWLTIVARDTYIAGTEDVAHPQRLRLLNEVQHRILGHICKLLAADQERYSDDSIARIALAEDDPELLTSFEKAINKFRRTISG